jgi:hypothetical protein
MALNLENVTISFDNVTNSSGVENASDYCSSEAVVSQVVYSSQTEKVVSLLVMFVVLVVTLLGQFSVIVTIIKTERLHIPNFMVIPCYCGGDLTMVSVSSVLYVYHFLYYCMPLPLCQALSIIGVGTAFGLASLTGLMAYERYVYLCHPLKYDIRFRTHRVLGLSAAIFAAPLLYCFITELMYGRSYHATVLACYLHASAVKSIIQSALFILPAAATTLLCMTHIWRLMRSASVAPMQPADAEPAANPRKHAKKAFKMVAMVSGTFWATILPSMFIRMLLFAAGFTWSDLDTRRYYSASLTLRIFTYMFSSVSSLLNPFIYYYSRRDLRQALMKLLGKPNAVQPHSIASTSANKQ